MLINMPVGLACDYDYNYRIPNHIEILNNELMDIATGKNKRLIICMPPRHGKSELVSKYFPAWYLLNYPTKRIILTSYEADFAASWGRKIKDVLNEYGNSFNVSIRRDTNAGHRFELTGGGQLNTAGAGGAITGKGADLLIIDDPIKNIEEANSNTMRNKVWDWYTTTAYTRLEPNGAVIIIMTRWHYDDLVGRILEQKANEKWRVVSLPAINDNGEALWSDRFSIEKLEEIKEHIGTHFFSALYQQQPQASEHQIFKLSYWNYYKELPNFKVIFQSWDTAAKDKETNDYSVCLTLGVADNQLYIIDMFRGKLEFPDLLKTVKIKATQYNSNLILIEDKSSGQALIQALRRETALPIRAVQVKGDKVLRANLFAPLLESGKVLLPDEIFFPDKSKWVADLIDETSKFPVSAHDDIVDALTQSYDYFRSVSVSMPAFANNSNNTTTKRYFNINRKGNYFGNK